MTLTTIIVDDETVARNRLKRMLADIADVHVVGEAGDGRSAVDTILHHRPDLVFLDIQMPELDGFGVVAALSDDELPQVVFVTAYDEYALRAFEVNALDYLLKPYEPQRLASTLERARERLRERPGNSTEDGHDGDGAERRKLVSMVEELVREHRALRESLSRGAPGGGSMEHVEGSIASVGTVASPPAPRRLGDRMLVKSRGRTFFVRLADIDYVESAANYVRLHVGQEVHQVRMKISDLADQLDPTAFARIHRTTIVNLNRVAEIQPWFSGDAVVILRDGTKLRLSRIHRSSLESRFQLRGEEKTA